MTEKEKRNAGMLYDANNDPEIFAEILRAHDICHDYNHLRPSQIEEREKIIRGLFGKTGRSFYIEQPFCCDFGYNITIGEKFYANIGCMIIDCAPVTFGDNSIVGAGSAVTHDIPANEVWAGNPARFIRKVRSEEDNMI